MANTLATLARLRKLETDLARRNLAHAVQAEQAADDALLAARQAPAREAALAAARPELAGRFGAWLPHAADHLARQAALAETAAQARLAASMALGERKAAAEAVATLQAVRDEAAARTAARRTQRVLDEAASASRRLTRESTAPDF